LLQLTLPLGIQSIINFVLAGSFSTSMIILIAVGGYRRIVYRYAAGQPNETE